MRLLVFTTLFPHPGAPHHGIFVLERLRHWIARGGSAVVVAPVPWVPKMLARGRYAVFADVPAEEQRGGLRVLHPRYALLPKVSMSAAPLSLARAGLRAARGLFAAGERFDLLDAHYLYPDGVAAALMARRLHLPLVVTARGSDVTQLAEYRLPRRWLRFALRRADAAVAVAEALRVPLAALAPADLPMTTLRNGVDLGKFHPIGRAEARARLSWRGDRRLVLSVGHLIERKGHHHLIAALPLLPHDVDVKIVGEGPWRARLQEQAERIGAARRVELVGAMAHDELAAAYSAADVLALLSAREGWPNVVLESLACGTPVVATRAGGTPEVVREAAAGTLVDSTEPAAVAAALEARLAAPADRAAVRAYAERHSWDAVVDGLQRVFEQALARAAARSAP
jgi:teichuronic acid biosynthesis glycosyltransferase TuaC